MKLVKMYLYLDGPFVGLQGEILMLILKTKIKSACKYFGRDTPVELENWQVENTKKISNMEFEDYFKKMCGDSSDPNHIFF